MLCDTCLPVVMAGTAVIMDLRTARVDNGWIVFCLVTGLTVRMFRDGPGGLPGCAVLCHGRGGLGGPPGQGRGTVAGD